MKIIAINNEIEKTNSSYGNYFIRTKISDIGLGNFEYVSNKQEYFMTKKDAKKFLTDNYKLIKL